MFRVKEIFARAKNTDDSNDSVSPDEAIEKLIESLRAGHLISEIKNNLGFLTEEYERLFKPVYIILYLWLEIYKHQNSIIIANQAIAYSQPGSVQWLCKGSRCLEFLGSATPEVRKANTQRWLLASAIAGLCHDLGKAYCDVAVRSESGKKEWNPFEQSLLEFKNSHNSSEVNVIYRKGRLHKQHEYYSYSMMHLVLERDVLSFLASGDKRILPTLYMAISGVESPEVPLFYKSISSNDQKSVKRAMKVWVELLPSQTSSNSM